MMQQNDCAALFADRFPFWERLAEADREQLVCASVHAVFAKGENIHGANNECTGAILVERGCIRVYLLSEEGREITLYRLYPGEICMLSASCVLKSITFHVLVDAEEDSACYIINGQAFARVAAHNIYAENFALNTAVERFSDVMWVMQQILFMSMDKRLAIFLWDEMAKTRATTLKLTQEQIAKYTGSAREVVSRMLKYFAAEGIVSHSRGGIQIIDKEKLRLLTL